MLNISQCKKYLCSKGMRASHKACLKLQKVADKLLLKVGELASEKAAKANRKTVMDEDISEEVELDDNNTDEETEEAEESEETEE